MMNMLQNEWIVRSSPIGAIAIKNWLYESKLDGSQSTHGPGTEIAMGGGDMKILPMAKMHAGGENVC